MRELRLVMLCLAAAIAILLGYAFLQRAFTTNAPVPVVAAPVGPSVEPGPTAPPERDAARAAIERKIAEAPDYARFFDRLHQVFPSDYEAILTELAAANQGKDVAADALMDSAVASLRRAHGALEARAPEDALAHVFALQLDEVKALEARDAHLCAAFFVFGAAYPGFAPFEAANRPLVANYAIAALDAMAGGQAGGVDRGEPSQADFDMLDKALVDKGLSRPEIETLLDGKTADPPIADGQVCKAGETYLETLASLPGDVRARLYSLSVRGAAKM